MLGQSSSPCKLWFQSCGGLAFLFGLCFQAWGQTADFRVIGETGSQQALVLVIGDSVDLNQLQLARYAADGNTVFHLYHVARHSPESVCKQVNRGLNAELGVNKQRIYLVTVGSDSLALAWQVFKRDLLAASVHLSREGFSEDRKTYRVFPQNQPVETWMAYLKQHYRWLGEIDAIRKGRKIAVYQKSREADLRFSLGPSFLSDQNYDEYRPSAFIRYDLGVVRRMNGHLFQEASFHMGFNLPNPRKLIQEQVRSQIDPDAILSGDDVDVSINTTLQGHLSFGAEVGLRYAFAQKRKLQPFVGLGVGFNRLMTISQAIDTTFTISSDDISSGGSFEPDGSTERDGQTITANLYLPVSTGAQLTFNRRWSGLLRASYDLNPSYWNAAGNPSLSSLNVQFGLALSLSGQKRYVYRYLTTSP